MELNLGTMLFQVFVLLILILLISRFAMKPMLATMKERQDYIDGQIAAAEQSRKDGELLLSQQQEALSTARQEAKEIVERAKTQKEREAEEIIQGAQVRAERMIKDATAEIAMEKEKALTELRDEVGRLTVALASKVMEKELDVAQQTKLVNRYLERVGELQ